MKAIVRFAEVGLGFVRAVTLEHHYPLCFSEFHSTSEENNV